MGTSSKIQENAGKPYVYSFHYIPHSFLIGALNNLYYEVFYWCDKYHLGTFENTDHNFIKTALEELCNSNFGSGNAAYVHLDNAIGAWVNISKDLEFGIETLRGFKIFITDIINEKLCNWKTIEKVISNYYLIMIHDIIIHVRRTESLLHCVDVEIIVDLTKQSDCKGRTECEQFIESGGNFTCKNPAEATKCRKRILAMIKQGILHDVPNIEKMIKRKKRKVVAVGNYKFKKI